MLMKVVVKEPHIQEKIHRDGGWREVKGLMLVMEH